MRCEVFALLDDGYEVFKARIGDWVMSGRYRSRAAAWRAIDSKLWEDMVIG